MSYLCPYCGVNFSAKKHVNRHIKTAKYCLDIQKSLGLNMANEHEYKCECGYKTLIKQNLSIHQKKCTMHIITRNNNICLHPKLDDNVELETTLKLYAEDISNNKYEINDKDETRVEKEETKVGKDGDKEETKVGKDDDKEETKVDKDDDKGETGVDGGDDEEETKVYKDDDNEEIKVDKDDNREESNNIKKSLLQDEHILSTLKCDKKNILKFSKILKGYPNTPAIYLLQDPHDDCYRITYGRTNNFRRRVNEYRIHFKFVVPIVHYYKQMDEKSVMDIETILHKIFHKYRNPKRSEWLEGISVDKAIYIIKSAIELYNN